MKVFVLGTDQQNFIFQIYQSVKKTQKQLFVATPAFKAVNNKGEDFAAIYDKIYFKKPITYLWYVTAITKLFFSGWFWDFLIYILVIDRNFLKAAHLLIECIKEQAFFLSNGSFRQYDIFHFHYIQYSYLRTAWMVPKNKKIIYSFWGSDLMRTADNFNHFVVRKALLKAAAITVHSIEMREILLSKYGRNLYEKVRIVRMPLAEKLFNKIDEHRLNLAGINGFCERKNILRDKIKIVVGHNSSPFNNHIEVIKQLEKVKNKEKLLVVVPFAYGIKSDEKQTYLAKIEEALAHMGIAFKIMDDYLTGDDLAFFRLATDIIIHLPASDALSQTVTEAAYAGAFVITGAWLPYSPFKKAGFDIDYIESFAEVAGAVDGIVARYITEKPKLIRQNIAAYHSYFTTALTGQTWVDLIYGLNTYNDKVER